MCTTDTHNIKTLMLQYPNKFMAAMQDDRIADIAAATPRIVKSMMAPCLTRTRCSQLGFYSIKRATLLNITDLMRLQGVAPSRFEGWQLVLSRSQMGAIVGNASPVNIMESVLHAVLRVLGIVAGPNRWARDRCHLHNFLT